MTRITFASTAILAALFVPLLHAAPAQATSTKTWVASNGTNNATCGRTTPCATFQQAHDATTAGGEINCVDAGDYGPVNITKGISIVCDNVKAGILAASSFGTAVTIAAGASDIITLKGLNISGPGGTGINVTSAAAVHVHNVQIRNFNGGSGAGILFQPNSYAELYVTDSFISDCGNSAQPITGGMVIRPISTGSVNASINRVRLENNLIGIMVNGSATNGVAVNATILDTVVAGSQGDGVLAQSGGAAASVLFDHSVASGNFGSGLRADGATSIVRLGDSTIVLNATGVSTSNGGVLQSFKNNRISGNLTDGTPIPAFPGPGGALQ